jgi:hypothetical protein
MRYLNLTIMDMLYDLYGTVIYIFHTQRACCSNRDPILYALFMILMLTLQLSPFRFYIIQTNNALFLLSLYAYFHTTI